MAEEWARTLVKVPVSHWSQCAALKTMCCWVLTSHKKNEKENKKMLPEIFPIGRTKKKKKRNGNRPFLDESLKSAEFSM